MRAAILFIIPALVVAVYMALLIADLFSGLQF